MNRATILFLLFSFFSAEAGAQVLRGTVVDEKQEPIADVHITVGGINIATFSNQDGRFELDVSGTKPAPSKLMITRVGYKSEEKEIRSHHLYGSDMSIELTPEVYQTGTMVVTATRTRRDMEEVGIPVSVVAGEEISQSGSMRLSEVLSEQTGMQIVNNHGTGVQVQGFDPDYTLIMIDGNPVIGRTAGTLDLTRISVNNVEQVEIVKGPSSALWGSDALAGVINVITEKETNRLAGSLSSRYGENSTLDLNTGLSYNTEVWSNNLSINRNSSGGYRLNPESVSQTVPDFENYTISYKTDLQLGEVIELSSDFRYFRESQQNREMITGNDSGRLLATSSAREDFFAHPKLTYSPSGRFSIEAGLMSSFYKTDNETRFSSSGDVHEKTQFNQFYNKPELQADYRWNNRHHTIAGGGLIFEKLKAERYPGEPDFTTNFLFAQHSWSPAERFELTGGVRYDSHSEYKSQVSPKFSARFRAAEKWQFRVSAGRGFKAPEFRQLFLDFTNTTAGYSVFGSGTVVEGIRRQMNEGTISEVLVPVESLDEIRAESSWAVNAGFDYDPVRQVRFRVNAFRNDVSNLIETAPVARKENGQSVFTYFNVDEVISQGIETELRLRVGSHLTGSVGYQFLDTRRRIERERTVQDDRGDVVQRTDISFETMFNRSKHSGNVKLFYEHDNGWGATFRGFIRGRYGQFDQNGNGYVDSNEYENGYSVWNISAKRSFGEIVTLRAGVDNLLGYKNINQPDLAGRHWYGQLSLNF